MKIARNNGIPLFRFHNLSAFPQLYHGVTTRQGGVSAPPFDSLNMARHVGDTDRRVAVNRQRVWSRFKGSDPVCLHQVHGNSVAVLDDTATKGAVPLAAEADAMVTDRPGQLLTILVADCQAVMLFDPSRAVIANIHSGWRGSIANIIGRTVAVMRDRFGCDPAGIHAGIGPSLGPCCAEFVHYEDEIPASLWSYRVSENHFDFWAISRDQLVGAGLPEDHIEAARLCTHCRSDLFFSYRASRRTGRMAAVIGMMPRH